MRKTGDTWQFSRVSNRNYNRLPFAIGGWSCREPLFLAHKIENMYTFPMQLKHLLKILFFVFTLSIVPGAVHAEDNPPEREYEKYLDLEKYKKDVVLLDFWASWCDPCVRSFPWMSEMEEQYGPKGFRVVTVNLDKKKDAVDRFMAKFPWIKFPIILDPNGNLANKWKLQAMPTSYLIDREGKVRHVHKGFFLEQLTTYEEHIKELVGESPSGNSAK